MEFRLSPESQSLGCSTVKVICGICGKEVDIFEAWIADRMAICGGCMREAHERSAKLWQKNP